MRAALRCRIILAAALLAGAPQLHGAPAPLALVPETGVRSCTAAPGRRWDIAVDDRKLPHTIEDTIFHQRYKHAVAGMVFENGDWRQRFLVLYRGGNQTLARSSADLLCRLYCYGQERLGPDGSFLDPMRDQPGHGASDGDRLYLDDRPDGGGEEQEGHLYLMQASRARNPVELAREIAHEYSHLVLPGIRGFRGEQGDEEWNNGYLGEVLFLHWASGDPDQTLFPRDALGKWSAARSLALERAFLRAGPGPVSMDPGSKFWEVEGMLLYLRELYGTAFLARLLHHAAGERAEDLSQTLADVGARWTGRTVSAPGILAAETETGGTWSQRSEEACTLSGGAAARCWAYLRDGLYRVRVEAAGAAWRIRGAIIDDSPDFTPLGPFTQAATVASFRAPSAGWYHFQWRNDAASPVTVVRWSWTRIGK